MRAAGTGLSVESINAPASLVAGIDFSDHASFWAYGYPAVMITDTAFLRNVNSRESSDTPDTLDYDRMAKVVNQELVRVLCRFGANGGKPVLGRPFQAVGVASFGNITGAVATSHASAPASSHLEAQRRFREEGFPEAQLATSAASPRSRRHSPGGRPTYFLNARLKAASDWYPTSEAAWRMLLPGVRRAREASCMRQRAR